MISLSEADFCTLSSESYNIELSIYKLNFLRRMMHAFGSMLSPKSEYTYRNAMLQVELRKRTQHQIITLF